MSRLFRRRGAWREQIPHYAAYAKAHPESGRALYNLACTEAQLKEKDKAFDFLFQAIDAGYDSPGHIKSDEDLDPLHGDPRFRKAIERAEARKIDTEY